MKWTREKPTVPGPYWYRNVAGKPFVVHVGDFGALGLSVCIPYAYGLGWVADTNGEWAGPLSPPEDA